MRQGQVVAGSTFTRLEAAPLPQLSQRFTIRRPRPVPSEPTLTLELLERAQSVLRFPSERR